MGWGYGAWRGVAWPLLGVWDELATAVWAHTHNHAAALVARLSSRLPSFSRVFRVAHWPHGHGAHRPVGKASVEGHT